MVAVIDSGWDRSVADDRVLPGIGLVDDMDGLQLKQSSYDHDHNGHGTLCTKLILEIAPAIRVLPIRVFGTRLEASLSQIREALFLAREANARIVSLSLATLRTQAIAELYPACAALVATGSIVVAAAFRSMRSGFPATFSNVIGVEAAAVPGPFDFYYQADSPIEAAAYGALDYIGPSGARQTSNSAASARLAGNLALYRECYQTGSVDDARAWLAACATSTSATIHTQTPA